ncbi:MAG TPA: SDR family NAD(P)-dependent oxidoreductase [Gaiellaceae bacterium]|nr:SDR family NAD(P)-dependent oxidoreductase [Gaiellaceae bacterium]
MAALDGKRAIVTGSSSGIGAATVQALQAAGARVVGGSRSTDPPLDVRDRASCEAFVRHALGELGGVDVLVNNAGLARGRDPAWEASEEDEVEVIETNVLGLMRMTRLCMPALIDSGAGHIVNLGSVAGIWSYANGSSYVASKFAVHGYTRALRDDLHGKPVRVTNIAPGLVGDTRFSQVRFHGDEEKARAVYADVALGGALGPQDVADCILFALTRPPHVNVDEIVLMALAQTSGGNILRESS